MNRYEMDITSEDLSLLIELAEENNIPFDIRDGSSLDNFVFYGTGNVTIGDKSTEYIIVKEVYLNSWSSGLLMVMTDSYKEVEEFVDMLDGVGF